MRTRDQRHGADALRADGLVSSLGLASTKHSSLSAPPANQRRDPTTPEPTGNLPMDPLTILLISLTTLVAANLAASRQKA